MQNKTLQKSIKGAGSNIKKAKSSGAPSANAKDMAGAIKNSKSLGSMIDKRLKKMPKKPGMKKVPAVKKTTMPTRSQVEKSVRKSMGY